jgi:hypothetical protein
MNNWTALGTNQQSFASLLEAYNCPPPANTQTSYKTQFPNAEDVIASGVTLHNLKRFLPSDLKLSEQHTLNWAQTALHSSAPVLTRHRQLWDSVANSETEPACINGESDTTRYFRKAIMEPALAAAIRIYAEHMGFTADMDCSHPNGRWQVGDLTSVGASGKADIGIVARRDGALLETLRQAALEPALSGESKSWSVCHSNGSVDGTYHTSLEIFPAAASWMSRAPDGVIPFDPPGKSASSRPPGQLNWYEEHWQQKLQKMFFQVRESFIEGPTVLMECV